MWFTLAIAETLYIIYVWLFYRYIEFNTFPYPLSYLSTPFQRLADFFYTLCARFYDFDLWVSSVADKLSRVFDINQIIAYVQTWIDKATNSWDWVVNAWSNVIEIVDSWWLNAQSTINYLIDQASQFVLARVNDLSNIVSSIVTWWNDFKSKVPTLDELLSWFSNWWDNVLTNISQWWKERLIDISSLFNSWLLSLSPMWEGWQDVRQSVFAFINDPFKWLLDRFADWFLGRE